jgi:hypothetical protein
MLFTNELVSPLKKALHIPWCRFIFGLRRVSLAEYLLVLRTLFPLLLRWSNVLRLLHQLSVFGVGRQLRSRTIVVPYFLSDAFVENGYLLALYLNQKCVCFMKIFASATLLWTWVLITLCSKLRCIQLSLRTLCNMWWWLLNLYDLGLYVGWFKILCGFIDYRVIRT